MIYILRQSLVGSSGIRNTQHKEPTGENFCTENGFIFPVSCDKTERSQRLI